MKPAKICGLLVLILIVSLASISCIRIVTDTEANPAPSTTNNPQDGWTLDTPAPSTETTPAPAPSATPQPTYTPPPTTNTPAPTTTLLPDLTILKVGFSSQGPFYQGDPIQIGMELANLGSAEARSVRLDLYIDSLIMWEGMTSALPPGGQYLLWASGAWIATAGNHTLTAIIDPDNVIREIDEGNNAQHRLFTIYP
jgi:subtilase family serine protease